MIVDFEHANVCCVHIEKINTFENKIKYIMRVARQKIAFEFTASQPYG